MGHLGMASSHGSGLDCLLMGHMASSRSSGVNRLLISRVTSGKSSGMARLLMGRTGMIPLLMGSMASSHIVGLAGSRLGCVASRSVNLLLMGRMASSRAR